MNSMIRRRHPKESFLKKLERIVAKNAQQKFEDEGAVVIRLHPHLQIVAKNAQQKFEDEGADE